MMQGTRMYGPATAKAFRGADLSGAETSYPRIWRPIFRTPEWWLERIDQEPDCLIMAGVPERETPTGETAMTNVRYVLEQCLGHFQSYEARHLAKGTEEDNARAASGREFITLCEAALDEVQDLETRGGMPKREAIEMMQRCMEEITMLRKANEALAPRAEAYGAMVQLLSMIPRRGEGMSEDLTWILRKRIEELTPKERVA